MNNNNSTSINTMDCWLASGLNISHPELNSLVPAQIFFSVANSICALPTIVINLLVIWTILEDENLRSASYNISLVALAVTDLLVGLVVEPLSVSFQTCLLRDCSLVCELRSSYILAVLICCSLSITSLMLTSVERYLAIEHPNFYLASVTAKKMIIATVLLWISLPALTASLAISLNNSYVNTTGHIPTSGIILCFCVAIILFCTAKVHITARRQHRAIVAQQQAVVQREPRSEQQENQVLEFKRSFTLGMLVLVSILFYCPRIVAMIIEGVKKEEFTSEKTFLSLHITLFFIHVQSLVNPLIMSLRLSYIRKGVKKKLKFSGHCWCTNESG